MPNLKCHKSHYAKKRFRAYQKRLANFEDKSLNIVKAGASIEWQFLESEYNLTYELNKNIASQLEQARFKLEEQKPVFQVLEGAKVPLDNNKPSRITILFLSVFLGVVIGGCFVLLSFISFKKLKYEPY